MARRWVPGALLLLPLLSVAAPTRGEGRRTESESDRDTGAPRVPDDAKKQRYQVAAIGDSLTDARSHGGKYLAYLRERCPESRFDNYGKGGENVQQMRRRFMRDVLGDPRDRRHKKPSYTHVIVFGGVNDLLRDQVAGRSTDKILRDLDGMYEMARSAGVNVVGITLSPWGGLKGYYNPRRAKATRDVNEWLLAQWHEGKIDHAVDAYDLLELRRRRTAVQELRNALDSRRAALQRGRPRQAGQSPARERVRRLPLGRAILAALRMPVLPLSARVRRALVALVAALGMTAAVLFADRWALEYLRNVVDDSLISMVFARRLATGDGLVFNPGEHVEGYTNFLWTVTLAPVYWLSRLFHGDFVRWSVGASILVSAIDVGLVVTLGRRLWGDRVLPLALAVGLCVLDNSYTVWAMMALESHYVALWALLALVVWTSRLRHRELLTGLCLAGVPLSRPDGALFVAAFALSEGLALLAPLWRGRWQVAKARLVPLLIAGGVFALVFGAYHAWRYHYYGWPFPNTYYLKVGSSKFDAVERGTAYVKAFFEERGDLPMLALLALPWIGNPVVRTLAIWVPVHMTYVAYVGGDFYPGHRFLVQLIPALALLIGHAVNGLGDVARRPRVDYWVRRVGVRSALGALVALYAWGLLGQLWVMGMKKGPIELEIRAWRYKVDEQRRYMAWLSEHSQPSEYICAGDIGSAGLYANLRVIDYYGVIDAYVAHQDVPTLGHGKPGHEKTAEVAYVLSRRPEYIKFGYLPGDFWSAGYYFKNDIPQDVGMPGLWVRDKLAETGHFEERTALHFEARAYEGWDATGDAFEQWPSDRPARGQSGIGNVIGWFVSSFHPTLGDKATGSLRSRPFPLSGERMVLRVGGGYDPERLRVSLVVNGQVERSETGSQNELLGRREWDISPFKGQEAVLEVVDQSSEQWGHIIVDEVTQWAPGTG